MLALIEYITNFFKSFAKSETRSHLFRMKILHKNILIGVVRFLLGLVYMFFDSEDYYNKKFLSKREFYWNVITMSQQSTEVSQSMVNNCYDAFYTIGECDTKERCNLITTSVKLRLLNRKRESLNEKYETLDREIKLLIGAKRVSSK